jgi:hypothetical protein
LLDLGCAIDLGHLNFHQLFQRHIRQIHFGARARERKSNSNETKKQDGTRPPQCAWGGRARTPAMLHYVQVTRECPQNQRGNPCMGDAQSPDRRLNSAITGGQGLARKLHSSCQTLPCTQADSARKLD